MKQVERAGLASHVKQGLWLLDPKQPPSAVTGSAVGPVRLILRVTATII